MKSIVIRSSKNHNISMKVLEGHFATTHSHINYFLDMTEIKSMHRQAKSVAREFAYTFNNTPVEVIICTERTKMIGAFLADELSLSGINRDQDILVITPEFNSFNQMLLKDNVRDMVIHRHCLILTASITTGITANSVIDGVNYYGGIPVGLATIFAAEENIVNIPMSAIFNKYDVPTYISMPSSECPLCKEHIPLDALVNSYGYSKF